MIDQLKDLLWQLLEEIDAENVEPQELRDLCNNPVFRALCAYCTWTHTQENVRDAFSSLLTGSDR